jgi:hypothetical protein
MATTASTPTPYLAMALMGGVDATVAVTLDMRRLLGGIFWLVARGAIPPENLERRKNLGECNVFLASIAHGGNTAR